jgi:hypothetical protein
MAVFVTQYEAVAALSGKDSPLFDLSSLLSVTRGNWTDQGNYRGGRQAILSRCKRQYSQTDPAADTELWVSPSFTSSKVGLQTVLGVLQAIGGLGFWSELLDYPTFIKLTSQSYDNQTPAYLPGGRVAELDEDGAPTGEEVKVRWDAWRIGPALTHTEHEGGHYIPLTWNGQHFAGSLLSELVGDGYDVRAMADWPVIEAVD